LAGPKGLPPVITKLWDDVAKRVLADSEYAKIYTAENLVPRYLAHDQYAPFITQFVSDTSTFLKSTGVVR
jgi:tripartite-type tricarboxylate transporter receptor subunit TctC